MRSVKLRACCRAKIVVGQSTHTTPPASVAFSAPLIGEPGLAAADRRRRGGGLISLRGAALSRSTSSSVFS